LSGRFDRFYLIAFAGPDLRACRDFVPSKSSNLAVSPSGTNIPGLDWSCDARRSRRRRESNSQLRCVMLSWVVTFLVVALIAGILGFGGIAGVSVEIAKAIFFIAVILFLVSAVVGLVRGRGNV
jgi:uncharacterized membrane protein YtjA (UPF0391 family)